MLRVNYGLIPDSHDPRDRRLELREDLPTARVPSGTVRLLEFIKNQYQLGSCTAQVTARLIRYALKRLGLSDADVSELMIYFMSRFDMGTTQVDSGASIRGSMEAARKYGACLQYLWDYKNWQNYWNVAPNQQALDNALLHQVLEYMAVDNTPDAINAALAAGYAISVGIPVFSSFENAPNGMVTMPQNNDMIRGYHNICLDKWNDASRNGDYEGPNSWGMWGNAGYFTMPYDYITRFGTDLKVIKIVEGESPIPPQPTTRKVVAVGARVSGMNQLLWAGNGLEGIGVRFDNGESQERWPTVGPIVPAPRVWSATDMITNDVVNSAMHTGHDGVAIGDSIQAPNITYGISGDETSYDAPGKGADV